MCQDGEINRRKRTGSRLVLILMLVAVMSILTACMEAEPTTLEYDKYTLHFLKVEKSTEDDKAYAYYESPQEQLYYKTELSSYQYNNWSKVGYPDKIEVLKNTYEYGSFGMPYYKAYILSSRDAKENKTFSDIKPDEITKDIFSVKLDVTEYWGDEARDTTVTGGSTDVSKTLEPEESEKSAE